MATEEQRKRAAAQKRNARRIRSGQPTERVSGLSREALSKARERAQAKDQGNPPPKPLKPSRVAINPNVIRQDQTSIRNREIESGYDLGFGNNMRGGLPKSYNDEYPDTHVYDTFPKYNYKREREESKRFNRQDLDQGDFIPLTYSPTKTSWPANGYDHRRTLAAGYSRARGIIRIEFFTDGAIYDYGTQTPIPPRVAYQFRLTQSPGRAIHAGPGWGGEALEAYGYERIS